MKKGWFHTIYAGISFSFSYFCKSEVSHARQSMNSFIILLSLNPNFAKAEANHTLFIWTSFWISPGKGIVRCMMA